MRKDEINKLHWNQVDLFEGALTVGKSKTDAGTGRVIPLNASYAVSEAHLWPRDGKLSARATVFSRASCPQLAPVSPVFWRSVPGGDQHWDGPGHARSSLKEPLFFQVDYHGMDRGGTDVKMPLPFVFRWGNAMHLRVLMDKRQIGALLLGELGFLLPPTGIGAEEINHFPALEDPDVLRARVIAGFDQPLTLPLALLLDLADCIFREVYPVAAVAAVGREKYLLRHSGSLAEDGGVFNGCPGCLGRTVRRRMSWAGIRSISSLTSSPIPCHGLPQPEQTCASGSRMTVAVSRWSGKAWRPRPLATRKCPFLDASHKAIGPSHPRTKAGSCFVVCW